MLNSPILDLAIALSFTYFLMALITSTINEVILTRSRARNKMLEESVNKLFFDVHWKSGLVDTLKKNPFIDSLKKEADKFPAYIPSRNFALAMLDIIRGNDTGPLSTQKIREKLQSADSPLKGEVQRVVITILNEAESDLDKFIKGLQSLFDDAMDRASGWYKRKYRPVLFWLSFSLTVILNIDTLLISRELWSDKKQLSAIANKISEDFNNNAQDGKYILTSKGDTLAAIEVKPLTLPDSSSGVSSDSTAIQDSTQLNNPVHVANAVTLTLKEAGIPVGWVKGNYPEPELTWNFFGKSIVKLIGWFLTAFAVYLGAPFWFDLMNKFVNLRGVGKKPQSADKEDVKK
jgi:hypothetical protein